MRYLASGRMGVSVASRLHDRPQQSEHAAHDGPRDDCSSDVSEAIVQQGRIGGTRAPLRKVPHDRALQLTPVGLLHARRPHRVINASLRQGAADPSRAMAADVSWSSWFSTTSACFRIGSSPAECGLSVRSIGNRAASSYRASSSSCLHRPQALSPDDGGWVR